MGGLIVYELVIELIIYFFLMIFVEVDDCFFCDNDVRNISVIIFNG